MGTSALDRADRRTYRDREVAACVEDRGVSSRRETTTSTLRRLGADAETVVSDLATGRAALPRLAMGSDDEGVVHVGIDREGDVVRLDLDAHWRDALPPARLGAAVTDALARAAEIRTGDWASALPPFMRPSVLAAVDRVHDATTTALALPVSSQAVAGPALRDHASALRRCLHLVDRPAGLPEAAAAWAEAGVALTEGLARARSRPPVLGRLGRRLLRAAG